jgi:hypothetical protein
MFLQGGSSIFGYFNVENSRRFCLSSLLATFVSSSFACIRAVDLAIKIDYKLAKLLKQAKHI